MLRAEPSPIVLTIGHSTRTLEEFIGLLQAHAVSRVVDVRTVPRSRHNPQFNKDSLPDSLKRAGVRYVHMPGLGGLRHAKRDSLNLGWRNASFRGYADYMQDSGICEEPRRIDPVGKPGPDRIDVRRSGAMALPSFAHRRRLDRSRYSHRGDHESNSPSDSHSYALCQNLRHHCYLSGGKIRRYLKKVSPKRHRSRPLKAE